MGWWEEGRRIGRRNKPSSFACRQKWRSVGNIIIIILRMVEENDETREMLGNGSKSEVREKGRNKVRRKEGEMKKRRKKDVWDDDREEE